MPYFAQLSFGVVSAITETSTPLEPADDIVEIDGLHGGLIGQTYDREAKRFIPPAPVSQPRHITKLAFRNRFLPAEKVAIEIASLDDPAASMAQRQMAAQVRTYQQDVAAATFIDLERADTRAGVQALEVAGVLGAGRAAQILDAPIGDTERYRG